MLDSTPDYVHVPSCSNNLVLLHPSRRPELRTGQHQRRLHTPPRAALHLPRWKSFLLRYTFFPIASSIQQLTIPSLSNLGTHRPSPHLLPWPNLQRPLLVLRSRRHLPHNNLFRRPEIPLLTHQVSDGAPHLRRRGLHPTRYTS